MLTEKNRGLFAQTTSEYTALLAWFLLTTNNQILAVAVLAFGIFNEHLTAWRWFGNQSVNHPTGALLLISLTETVLWVVWLILFDQQGWLISGIFLAVTMLIQHSFERTLFKTGSLGGNPLNLRLADFTLIEVVGATAWLVLHNGGNSLVGAIVLFVALFIEHMLQESR